MTEVIVLIEVEKADECKRHVAGWGEEVGRSQIGGDEGNLISLQEK